MPAGTGYRAEFKMTDKRTDWEILKKAPYCWNFTGFSQPNQAVQDLIRRSGWLPGILLSDRNCVQPPEFLEFMDAK
jgi:hypothetical protein